VAKLGDTVIMVSDGRALGTPVFQGFALSLQVRTAAEAAGKLFGALADGGQDEPG
jgi:PhnB protein